MKNIKLIALIALFSILIVSCGKKSNLGKMIPKEAGLVIDINSKSILSKVSWEDIKKTYWYNEIMTDTSIPAKSKAMLEDPTKAGINMESEMICFTLKHETNSQFVVEGNLKDAKLFVDHLKSRHPEATISKDGELNILTTTDAVVDWNNEKFAMVTVNPHGFDKNVMGDDSTKTLPLPKTDSGDLAKVCKSLFSLSDANSMYENEKFAKLTEEEGDIHFWINVNALYDGSMKGMQGMAGMVKLDKFLVDNIATVTVNFQDGKIDVNHKQYYGKELSDIVKKGEGNMNTDMIKKLPSQNVAAVTALHITPSSILEMIKLTGLDGFINLFMAQQGLSLEDAMKATTGDMVFSVSDIAVKVDSVKSKNDTMSNGHSMPDATFLFAIAIGDKDAFNKLLSMGDKMGKEESMKNIAKKRDDKYFVIGNSQEAVNKYLSAAPSNHDYLSKISDHPVGGFLDIQMILKALQPEIAKDTMDKAYYDRSITMWNNVYFSGGEFKDGGINTHAEINLVDKSTNSLKQLNQYIDDNARIRIERKKKEKAEGKHNSKEMKTDSVTVTKKKPHGKTRK